MPRIQYSTLSTVAVQCDIATGYTPAVGDLVQLSGDYEVAAQTDGEQNFGHVSQITATSDNRASKVTIETRGAIIREALVDTGNLSAGDLVVKVGVNTVRPYVAGSDDASLIGGLCVQGADVGETCHFLSY